MRKERVRERIFYFTWWWALQQPDPILKLVIFPEATTTQLLEKRSPKLLHRITVLPLILTTSKIIKFVYLSSAQENKNRFLEATLSEISDGKHPDGGAERKDLQGNRRTVKISLTSFLPISTEEEISTAILTLHREGREDIRESNCIFLSLLLYTFLSTRRKLMCQSSQAWGTG